MSALTFEGGGYKQPEEVPSEEQGGFATTDTIHISVPHGIERVSQMAINALRHSEAVISYCTEDVAAYGGPMPVRRRPQA